MLRNKLLIGIAAVAIFQSAFCGSTIAEYNPGFYFGVQAGYGELDEGNGPQDFTNKMFDTLGNPTKSKDELKVGGGIFVGYSFTPYFSVDTGFTLYPSTEYKSEGDNALTGRNTFEFSTDFYAVDLMAKAVLPFENIFSFLAGWSMYGKLGPAVTITSYKTNISSDAGSKGGRRIVYAIKPSYEVGVCYDFSNKFSMSLSWGGIYSKRKLEMANVSGRSVVNVDDQTPAANLIMLGISYKFDQ